MTSAAVEPTPTAAPAASVIASVRDLRVHFRTKAGIVHAVDGVNFDIRNGETLGLVGETGCGKSVTARSFLQLVPMPPGIPVSGSILFRPRNPCPDCLGEGCSACDRTGRVSSPCPACSGEGCQHCDQTGLETIDLLDLPDQQLRDIRGDRIAMIFQDPGKALNPALSVRDQLGEVFFTHRSAELLDAAGIDPDTQSVTGRMIRRKANMRSRGVENLALAIPPLRDRRVALASAADGMVAAALAETQIPNPMSVMDRFPHELSGGMKQRVMIAQALACNPDLLIADEPTTALDVTVQARIIELISQLQERYRTAVLYISHDLSLVRRVCDRTAVMYAGQIVEVGDSDQIFHDPEHPYTQGLIEAIPSTNRERGRLEAIEGTVPELIEPESACRFAGRCPHTAPVCTTHDPVLEPIGEDRLVACFIHNPPATVPTEQLPRPDGRLL